MAAAPGPDGVIIKPLSDPWNPQGGLAVLKGNLAPDSAVTKPAAIRPEIRYFQGTARCFDSEEEADQAILDGQVKEGDVVVIRYEGPKGGPGMREMAIPMKMLYGRGLALKTALITDGRFSGTNNGCFVGHISPEAAEGGPIAAVRDGDRITIDVEARSLTLEVPEEEIKARLANVEKTSGQGQGGLSGPVLPPGRVGPPRGHYQAEGGLSGWPLTSWMNSRVSFKIIPRSKSWVAT